MAILPMIMGSGGSQYTETSLWTNQSPTSNFAAQTVTLSDSIDNYKYIAIKYAFNGQLQTESYVSTMIAAVDDVKKWGYNTGAHHAVDAIGVQNSTNYTYTRACFYISSTSIRFADCYQTGSTSNNAIAIPLEILGLNELDHGTILSLTNPMACTPFRNTTPAGGTLTIPSDGTYLIAYIYQTSTGDFVPTVVSGSMTIKQTISEVTTANNYNAQSAKMTIRSFVVEATANTVIRGSVASGNTLAYALKIN